ncbi:putative disease resistance protein RPP13-like [Capsicum annuum]|uniref:NB-ARC domain-containing protein n=1 Tax=Capsicum annuum TaxID=4072 RepID=A0A2G2YQC2_CAPAN|nr:putative disease resistance protein RPP13-like [Capsicum annuum]KAF3641126.1 putative disease resistance protein RPP13-like [Capsicum annuum]PHT71948.1 hypothetical protein T459_22733 [Capsicum annuum]
MLVKLKDHVVPRLLENIKSSIISNHHSESSAVITEDQLVELLDVNVYGNLRYFHGLIVNGSIERKTMECFLPEFQLMAERVGHFYFVLLCYQDKEDKDEVYYMLVHLLLKIIPVSLEVMHICYTNLKASKSAEVGHFIKQLLKAPSDILREYLIHLQQHMVNAITPSTSVRNIHVNERVGALTKEVLVLVNNLEENSRNEENMKETSVALIKKEIGRVKEDLEHIRSFFGNVEQELHRDLWTRVLNVEYKMEHAINSILDRDHGLLQLIFLLPDTVGKIKLVKKEVKEKICKNTSIIFANSPNKPVINKSSIASKIIVGFEEKAKWIIQKLTSGPAEVDVISIVGMPGLGKTTLAYRVYIEKSIVGHFNVRSWCTVDQERNEKKLLQKIFNEVIGLKERVGEDVIDDDVAAKLRIQLFGKRPEESWELLEKRIFGEEHCPDELKDVGEKIAKKCDGLPLNEEKVMKVIKLSYYHLSDHLKPCFLYLESYPKEKNIRISELKDLWSDERLVEPSDLKSVEEVMEVYVVELISSSLVIVRDEFFYPGLGGVIDSLDESFGGVSLSAPSIPPTPSIIPPFVPESAYGVPLVLSVNPLVLPIYAYGTLQTPSVVPSFIPVFEHGISILGVQPSSMLTPQVIADESFPVLEELEIRYCTKLTEIPEIFGDIASLKSISVLGRPQLKESALKIREYDEEMTGEDKLEVKFTLLFQIMACVSSSKLELGENGDTENREKPDPGMRHCRPRYLCSEVFDLKAEGGFGMFMELEDDFEELVYSTVELGDGLGFELESDDNGVFLTVPAVQLQ